MRFTDETTGDYQRFFDNQVATYRKRLLNLSLNNRLLNFKHSERGKNYVRIVNTKPDLFVQALANNDLDFVALPPLNSEPEDEKTDEFLRALEQAKLTDEIYLKALSKLDTEGANEKSQEAFELDLRNRVRAELGLPPRRFAALQSTKAWAKQNGINPNYDLSPDHDALAVASQTHKLQTLLYKNDLERSLNRLNQLSRESMQEMGINTLYAIIGFLEWFEDENSHRAIQSPLLMYPVELKRNQRRGNISYKLGTLDNEIEINYSLQERLKSFNIALPEYDEGEGPSQYIKRVQDLIREQLRWSVKSFITITVLSFSRMVLYRDLDPNVNYLVKNHDLVQDLLIGTESNESNTAEVYDIESEPLSSELQPILYNADSSQLSAIKDALDGKNLVIKGPPGTGKSQTITNIIGALLDRGKTVLFVAEKMAALEVVKSRLDQAGLGPFCLELHSTKAKRNDVIDSFKKRLNVTASNAGSGSKSLRAELIKKRQNLNDYASTINLQFGSLGLTINELIWRLQHHRERTDLPVAFKSTSVPNLTNVTTADLVRVTENLKLFTEHQNELEKHYGSINNHPWYGLADKSVGLPEPLIAAVQNLCEIVEMIDQQIVDATRQELVPQMATPTELIVHLETNRPLTELLRGKNPDWLRRFRDNETREIINKFLSELEHYYKNKAHYERSFTQTPDISQQDETHLLRLSQLVQQHNLIDILVGDVPGVQAECDERISVIKSIKSNIDQLLGLVDCAVTDISQAISGLQKLHTLLTSTAS
jgi:hypothetical protein